MANLSVAEAKLCEYLTLILDKAEVGEPLWAADYDSLEGKQFLNALEFYLPALLRLSYPSWEEESLDSFMTSVARKTGPNSIELFGGALLITDQRWTPFDLALRLAQDRESVEWLELSLGSPGPDKQGLDRRFLYRHRELALREYEQQRDRNAWVFTTTLPDS